MMLSAKLLLIILVSLVCCQLVSPRCRQSFMTICDTFEDLQKHTDPESLSELMIGSEHNTNMTSVNLMNALNIRNYYKLTTLIIISAINQLEFTYAYECTYKNSPLKYFTLYGNILKRIQEYHFPVFGMKKFSLVNNRIETIESGSFTHHEVENIDLSDNLMEVIEKGALPSTGAIKTVTINNNKLTHIESGSFVPSLESLNLDKNILRYFEDGVLNNLVNLKELTLSHNKFNKMPQISYLKNLIIFDISFNSIDTIPKDTFKEMDNLKLLDLSNNNIYSDLVLQWLHVPGKQPSLTVSLALNNLRNLNLSNISLEKKTLVLYGNPWDCNSWPTLKNHLSGHESKCDLKFLASGNVPFCINYRSGGYPFGDQWKQDIDRLHENVRKNEKNSGCNLKPKSQNLLKHISFGCVA